MIFWSFRDILKIIIMYIFHRTHILVALNSKFDNGLEIEKKNVGNDFLPLRDNMVYL